LAGSAAGGGVFNSGGTVNIINSSVSSNTALAGGGIVSGGGGNQNFGVLNVSNSTVSGNTSFGTGAGIWNLGPLTVVNSTVSGNTATGVNGAGPRVAGVSNIYFDGAGGEALLIALDLAGFAMSTGSACSSGAVEPSHVLLALGCSDERARASLRFSLGRSNDEAQVDALVDAVAHAARHVRSVAPKAVRHG